MVAIAGVPGSGKSRAAQILERLLGADCLHVPMDGSLAYDRGVAKKMKSHCGWTKSISHRFETTGNHRVCWYFVFSGESSQTMTSLVVQDFVHPQ